MRVPTAIIDSIESLRLPPIPQILLQFLHLANDDGATIADLAKLVGQDPSLSARILTVANSPAMWRGVEAKTLTQCLVNLGTRLSRTLAACLIVQNFFAPAVDKRLYCFNGFWRHSLQLAETARAIAQEINYPDSEEAYLSGLLHDIGQLMLLGGLGNSYGALLAECDDEASLREVESQALGTEHSAIGAWLVDQWRLSSFMSDAILFHHASPDEIVTANTLCQIVWSAHALCKQAAPGLADAPPSMEELAAIKTILGVDIQELLSLCCQCDDRVHQIINALGYQETPHQKSFPTPNVSPEELRAAQTSGGPSWEPLDDMVRDMALMQSLQRDLVSLGNEEELLLEIRESARILFGVGNSALLLAQPDAPVLSGAHIGGQPLVLRKLEVPLEPALSLASVAASGKIPLSTFGRKSSTPVSLADVQIARALESEGLLYVPLRTPRQIIGVLVFGVTAESNQRLGKQQTWILNFGDLAALSIETLRDMRAKDQRLESAVSKRYELQTRRVIHEAKNPLSIIKNYINIVRKKLPDADILQELDILKEEIDRIAIILRQMSGPVEQPSSSGSLDINSLIESMFTLYGDSLFTNRGIASEINLEPGLAAIDCDRDTVKQILLNLWHNASDVMGAGDCVFISTHSNINHNGSPYLEIRLSDTGPGMPQDVMRQLFKPLPPNRRPGHSGVGLSIVAGLVDRLDGRITCQSVTGRGTSFSILLPQIVRNDS